MSVLSFEPEVQEEAADLKLQKVEAEVVDDRELALKKSIVDPTVRDAKSFAVIDNASNEEAAGFLKKIKADQKEIKNFFAEMKEAAAAAHKAICNRENSLLKPLQESETLLKDKMSAFWQAQEKLRIEAERKAAEEAAKLNAAALDAVEAGDEDKAQKLAMESAMKAAGVQVSAPQKVSGISVREGWKWEVTDINAIPRQYLIVNEQMLTAIAKSTKGSVSIPGIRFYSEKSIAARTA